MGEGLTRSSTLDRRRPLVFALGLVLACRPIPAPETPLSDAAPPTAGTPVAPEPQAQPKPAPLLVTPEHPQIAPLPQVVLPSSGKAETRELGGGWRVTLQPADIIAAPGDEVTFTVELRASRRGSGRPVLSPSYSLRMLDPERAGERDHRSWLPLQGGVARGVVVASPEKWSYRTKIAVDFLERQAHGSLSYADVVGPRVHLDTSTAIMELRAQEPEDRCDLPRGLSATVEGRRVTVYYSSGVVPMPDWVHPRGDFVVRRISGRLTLVGFVQQDNSGMMLVDPARHTCSPPDTRGDGWRWWTSAVMAQFDAPEPGPIDLVIYAEYDHHAQRHVTAVLVD